MSHTTTELKAMIDRLEGRVDWLVEEIRHLRHQIRELFEFDEEVNQFTVRITGDSMAITVGSTGTFTAQLEDNGNPIPLPAGSTFAWSADDTNASLAPSADTLSVVVSVPATDTATSITVTAETVAPDGNKV